MRFLVFTIYAPLASWGDVAVGEVRGSWDRPSRSGILGFIAASLGLTREDAEAHLALDMAYGVAVRSAAAGTPFIDYHTAQDPSQVAIRRHAPTTRKEALECAQPETSLSQRTLRQDSLSVISIWSRGQCRWSLDEIASALRAPTFVLYAGRKANVLGLPLDPRVVESETLAAALSAMPTLPNEFQWLQPRQGWGREVAHDSCEGFQSGLRVEVSRDVVRRDASPQRTRWQFSERRMHVGVIQTADQVEVS